MLTTQPVIQNSFDSKALRSLAAYRGPCLTLFLPVQRPGSPTGSHAMVLRQLLRSARQNVDASLLDPLEAFLNDPALQAGGPGFVIFRSKDVFEIYQAPGLTRTGFVAGTHFHLTPLLGLAVSLKEFFILGINQKRMRLYQYLNADTAEIEWPEQVPSGFNDAEGAAGPVPENRSSTGVSPGSMWSVQFGSKGRPKREGADDHFHHFFKSIDNGITPLLHGKPLVLAGVASEIELYRKVAKYPRILEETISGNQDHATLAGLTKRAEEIALQEFFAGGRAALQDYRHANGKGKTASGPREVFRAAEKGRVHKLCMREDASALEAEDLVNAAVAETLRTGGDVAVVHPEDMPDDQVVALLRF